MTCPADDELVRMVEGALGDASLAAIETHVDSCERCAALIAELGAVGAVGGNASTHDASGKASITPRSSGRRTLASYQLDRRIAAGGMGEVWAAWDPSLEREVAVKLVHPERADDERERARLLREARALAKLAHPNVLAVYDVGEVDGELYLATELVSGDTLASRGGPSSDWRGVTRLYLQAARGLAAAHAVGLVHRDVKPANLLVGVDGRVRVADFGLAVRAAAIEATPSDAIAPTEPAVTMSGHIAGTPAYMAPEQRAGLPADARSDQFSLALALAEGIDGRRPSGGATVATLRAFFAERRKVEPELDALCVVIARALCADPDARYPAMTELGDALEALVGTARDVAVPATTRPSEQALARVVTRTRRKIAVGGIAVGAAALAAAVAIGWIGGSGGHATTPEPPVARIVVPEPVAATLPPPPVQPPQPTPTPTPIVKTPAPRPTSHVPSTRTPPPPQIAPTVVTPPIVPGTGGAPSSAGDLEAVERAIHRRDGKACNAALATVDLAALAAREHRRAQIDRAHCDMVAGDCDKGTAQLTTLYSGSNISNVVTFDAELWCTVDVADPAVRLRRMERQAEYLIDPSACDHYVKAARAIAADAHDQRSKLTAASLLVSVAKCMSQAEHCDQAHTLLHEAGALIPGVDNPSELTSACQ